MKRCTKCLKDKDESEFRLSMYAKKDGTRSPMAQCRDCKNAATRAYMAVNADKYRTMNKEWFARLGREGRKKYGREAALRQKYRMTAAEYDVLLSAQGNRCAICKTDKPGGKDGQFHVDHDHSCCPGEATCGRCVRGILCHSCNVGIGSLGDNRDVVMSAFAYLSPAVAGAGEWL